MCNAGGIDFIALLDTGAEVNLVSEHAANKMKCTPTRTDKFVTVVGGSVYIKELVCFEIILADVRDTVDAYVVAHCPVDVLLGVPFLWKHSAGFRQMASEFPEARLTQEDRGISVATLILWKDKLEQILSKYPKLILEKGQLPPADRYYKEMTFELGIPDDERDKIFYKPRYRLTHQQIKELYLHTDACRRGFAAI